MHPKNRNFDTRSDTKASVSILQQTDTQQVSKAVETTRLVTKGYWGCKSTSGRRAGVTLKKIFHKTPKPPQNTP